jgi:acetoin utilization protein AcuB
MAVMTVRTEREREECMHVRDFMKTRVDRISGADSAENALARMRQKRIHHLVVTRGSEVLGVVSDRDLRQLGSSRRTQTVEQVMSFPVITASPDTTLRKAANLLRGRTVGCLAVMEDGKLVGILTITDLLELVGRGAERPVAERKRWVMKGRGPRRKSVVGHKGFVAH